MVRRHGDVWADGKRARRPSDAPAPLNRNTEGALEEVADAVRPDEQICAFVDDVYIVCQPERVRVLYNLLAESGIRLHHGMTRVWNASGTVPVNVEELGPVVWQPRGITSRFLALAQGHP